MRGAFAVACEPLPAERARRWLLRRAGTLGVALEDAATDHLLAATGNDLGAVSAELQKLAALPAGAPLTADQVGALVGIRHGETIYDWRDAVLDGAAGRAVAMVGPLLDQSGVTAVKLITLLGTTLIGVGLARAHYDRRVRGGNLERLVFERLRQLRLFGLPDWKAEERPMGAVGRAPGPPPGCARGFAPRATPTRRSRAPRSPASAAFSPTWSFGSACSGRRPHEGRR